MAIVGIGLCLSAFFACFIVSTPFVQGRSLRRRHDHHSHSDYDFDESISRILSRRLEDDTEYRDSSYRRTDSRKYPQVFDESSEEKSFVEERVPSARRYKHEYGLRNYDSLRRNEELRRHDDFEALSSMKFVARRKRHNKLGTVSYHRFTEQDKKDLLMNRQRYHELELRSGGLHTAFELEVKEAQNSSICNYTVESIPDTRGSRVPKDLEHIRCNHAGSSCQDASTYCCIQTFRNIEVSYGDGVREPMKIYVGCVCALQVFNGLQVTESPLPIND